MTNINERIDKIDSFQIRTDLHLFTLFSVQQFIFECLNGGKKEQNQELFKQAMMYMPMTELDRKIYYRSRIIKPSDGEDTGIIKENGIPITGYDDKHSGVSPVEAIKQTGRVNHIGEQVLYLAEDIETSCKELKAAENDYISVAECDIKNRIKVMDFTIKVPDGLDDMFSDEKKQFFINEHYNDIRAFYIIIKNYLSAPYHAELNYAVPLDLLDIVKKRNDISGVKYKSFYTDKYNIALWDENKNSRCTNGRVVKDQDDY